MRRGAREAFRAGFQAGDPAAHRSRRRRGTLAKLLTLKVAIATVISATTVGGVALAANTRVLPAPFRPPAKVEPTPPRPAPEAEPETRRSQPAAPPGPASTPSLAELCRAYQKPGGAPADPPLITAAGGRKKVADYCRTLLDAKPEPGANLGPAAPPAPPAPSPPAPSASKKDKGPAGPRLKP